jgi:hypothetical protein
MIRQEMRDETLLYTDRHLETFHVRPRSTRRSLRLLPAHLVPPDAVGYQLVPEEFGLAMCINQILA